MGNYQKAKNTHKILPDNEKHQICKIISESMKNDGCLKLFRNDKWIKVINFCNWDSLIQLSLPSCKIDDDGMKVICTKKWPNLQMLTLSQNQIGNDGVQYLTQNYKNFPNIQFISLYENRASSNGFELILKRKYKNIKLDVSKNYIQARAFYCIEKFNVSTFLELWLGGNIIGCQGIKLLARSPLNSLRLLWIEKCCINNQGARSISKTRLNSLQNFYLNDNYINLDGFSVLAISNFLSMKYLGATEYNFQTKEGLTNIMTIIVSILYCKKEMNLRMQFSNHSLNIIAKIIMKMRFESN